MNRRRSWSPGAVRLLLALLGIGLASGITACTRNAEEPPPERPASFSEHEMNAEITRLRELIIERSRGSRNVQADLKSGTVTNLSSTLRADGSFSDLDASDHATAFRRLRILAVALAAEPEAAGEPDLKKRVYRGLIEYSRREAAAPTIFPRGAFAIPRDFLASWFALYDEIQRDLQHPDLRPLVEELREAGGKVAEQAWVYPDHSAEPFRADNPLSIEVFRGQGHFTVANFVPYRPVVEYAVFRGDERYLEIIEEVAKRSLREPVHPADPAKGFWTEGIHPDLNITAHGPQTYIFGYGKDYLNGLLNLAEFFEDGPRAFSQQEFDVMADVLLDAFVWFIYRDQMDYTVLGRHNLYPTSGDGGNRLAAGLIERLLSIGGDRLTRRHELVKTRDRLRNGREFAGSRYFWNTEEYVHRSDDFSVVVNINSTRTTGPEIVKPWAEQNFHFANGAMMLYRDGTEYGDARGAWRLRALPGITAEFSEEPPPYIPTWNGIRGTERFAGGVSDGSSGACAFVSALEGESVRARKAWFFHQDTIVCLGSGIFGKETDGPIRTTLNQTGWRSPIHLLQNGQNREFTPGSDHAVEIDEKAGPIGVWQDGVSYLIEAGKAGFSAAVRPTDWVALAEINEGKPAPEEAAVFHLFLDHGRPESGVYAYAVRPGTTPDEMAASIESPEWKILANTPAIQAVEFPEARLVQGVFREAGFLDASGLTVEVNRPLIVMLRELPDGGMAITWQDPLHQTTETEVELILTLPNADGERSRQRLTLDLPQGIDLGRPLQKEFHP